jgi:DNA-binding transcriptional MerR regulator
LLQIVPTERTYDSATFAKKLGIKQSTLRNYKSYFSKAGISFQQKNNKTVYTEKHLQMFQEMMALHNQSNGTISKCVLSVLDTQDTPRTVLTDQNEQQIQSILERIKQQEQELQNLRGYIDSKLEQRDSQLINVVREIQTLKKELATAKEKKWWQFWK